MERKLLWPDLETENGYPDIVLSIGTAFNPRHVKATPESQGARVGMFANLKALYRLAVDHIESSLDGERTWDNYLQMLSVPERHQGRFRRINPRLDYDPPKLDDVGRMKSLQDDVRAQITRDKRPIIDVAQYLVATCFYFEPARPVEALGNGSFSCIGASVSCLSVREAIEPADTI